VAELKSSRRDSAADKEGADIGATQVRDYLREHPEFFAKHPELLEAVDLRHKAGTAVSLIERQVEILRAKNQRLEDRLERLMDAARGNEKRTESVHRLARTLMRAPSLAGVAAGLRQCMREEFDIDECFIGVSSLHFKRHDIEGLVPLDGDGKIAKAFENFMRTRLIECGPIAEARARLLFPAAKQLPQSAAVVPLEKEKNLGMIAFGSRDAERFQPRQGKLFLEMAADLVSAALRARL
jgi:uncharacterized protein